MLMRTSHARGQALFETALFMPLFLLGLFGVMLAAKQGALTERVQLGVRYGGIISTLEQPYMQYSTYAMYATTVDGKPPVDPASCDGATANTTSNLTVGRASFWQPVNNSVAASCIGAVTLVKGKTQNMLLQGSYMGLSAAAPVDGFLSANTFGGATTETAAAAENFMRSPDVGSLLGCTPIGDAVKASLEGPYDTSTPDGPPSTPFPPTVPATPLIVAPSVCRTFAPVGGLPESTPPPPQPSSPPSTPTPTPNPPTPSPPPTPKSPRRHATSAPRPTSGQN